MAQPTRTHGGSHKKLIAEDILKRYRPTQYGRASLAANGAVAYEAQATWIGRFAETVVSNSDCSAVWKRLEGSCDISELIDLLYLFTYRGRVRVDKSNTSHHLLQDRLKKLVHLYEKLNGELRHLMHDPQLSHALTYVGVSLVEQSKLLGQALRRAKENSSYWGSYKTDPRDWYLHLLATHIREATGSANIPAIIALIEASRVAHGERRQLFNDEGTVKKRLQRYEERLQKLQTPRSASHRISSDENDKIPF